jgi:hypothetical protein
MNAYATPSERKGFCRFRSPTAHLTQGTKGNSPVFALPSPDFVAFCEDLGVRWQSATSRRVGISSAREANESLETLARTKAAWRFASRRSPKFGCGLAALRLCVKESVPTLRAFP